MPLQTAWQSLHTNPLALPEMRITINKIVNALYLTLSIAKLVLCWDDDGYLSSLCLWSFYTHGKHTLD